MITTRKSFLSSNIQFFVEDNLFYYTNFVDRKRLCLSKKFEKKIFAQIHDNNNHAKFTRIYECIVVNFYFKKFNNRLHRYIDYCHECQLNQTKKHAIYDNFNSIVNLFVSFHIIYFDFIFAFFKQQKMNTTLIVTCKFFKKTTILSNKNIYNAKQWAIVFVENLIDWDISRVFIHDKNRKFMSNFWRDVFKKLKMHFLTFVVYHSQTNNQNEKTNQTIKIIFRYVLSINSNLNWITFLFILRTRLNNLFNFFINLSFNELIINFKTRNVLTILKFEKLLKNWFKRKINNTTKIEIIIVWVNIKIKKIYNKYHRFIQLKIDEIFFFNFHKNYILSFINFVKLSIQRVDFFKIIKKIDNLIYQLDLFFDWKIHSIIFVIYLEFASIDKNSYDREKFSHFESISKFNVEWHDYKIEKLLERRVKRYDKEKLMYEYFVRWKNYKLEFDQWYEENLLANATNMI